MAIEEAAGVSLVALTAAQSIRYRLGLEAIFVFDAAVIEHEHPEWPRSQAAQEPEVMNFLIYGASTSVGLYAAQMARISARASGRKLRLFGVASKGRWDLLKSEPYKYDRVVDYRDEYWHEQIQALSDGEKKYTMRTMQYMKATLYTALRPTLAPDGRLAIVRPREGGARTSHSMATEPI